MKSLPVHFRALTFGSVLLAAHISAAGNPTATAGLPPLITGELPRDPATPEPLASPAAAAAPTPLPARAALQSPAPNCESILSGEPEVEQNARRALDRQSLLRQQMEDQLAAESQLAERAIKANDAEAAEHAFTKILSLPVPAGDKRGTLEQMATYYKNRHELARAASVYEKLLGTFPEDAGNPSLFFELGRIYLDAGLYDLAISRFYSVLNSSIAQSAEQDGTHARRDLSLLAQFEIAESSFAKGDFAGAAKFYSRLQLLDLPNADRPTLAFKLAQSLFGEADFSGAGAALRGFIDSYPGNAHAAEARDLLARSLQKLKRPQEATDAVLALLRMEKKSGDAAQLARWQRETGRQVAAQFYEDGDFRSALTIYQTLATLDTQADWQWPIVYQIGLCFERLNLPERAREAYAFLQRPPAPNDKSAPNGEVPPALAAIRDMAQWRDDHLNWEQSNGAQLQALLGSLRKVNADLPAVSVAPPSPVSSNTPAASAIASVPTGNPAAEPTVPH